MFAEFLFRNSAPGVCVCEVPLPNLSLKGIVFAKFRFCNSALGVMC